MNIKIIVDIHNNKVEFYKNGQLFSDWLEPTDDVLTTLEIFSDMGIPIEVRFDHSV